MNKKHQYCESCDAPMVNGLCKRCNLKKEIPQAAPAVQKCKHCNFVGKLLLTFTNPNGYLCESCHCKHMATQDSIFSRVYQRSELTKKEAQESGIPIKDYCLMQLRKNPLGQMILNNIGENNER